MYKLPQDFENLQDFAEQEGETCAKSLSAEDRTSLNLNQIANNFFSSYKEKAEEQGEPFSNDIKLARKIFVRSFEKGFALFHSDKLY